MIVVSDTSPLRYLILIEAESVLFKLFGEVVIPPAVFNELQQPRTPQIVRDWVAMRPAWLHVRTSAKVDPSLDVDLGEAEAITLASELRADALLIDDKKGRSAASSRGITTIGTLTVLEIAAQQGLVDLRAAFGRLRATNFRVSERMIHDALDRDSRHRQGNPSETGPNNPSANPDG